MNPQEYQRFTAELQHTLERDPRVLGLMAAGSMADQSHPPDEWSDHDFWVIVEPESASWFHTHSEWLPDSSAIVLYFQEPHGGLKAVYRSGHLLEFAVSGSDNLLTAKVNDYRLLIDRIGLAADLEKLYQNTAAEFDQVVGDDICLLGQFLTNLLVGVWRFRRGEQLSARQFITVSSLYALLRLIPKHIASPRSGMLDNLDPLRRFEMAYSEIATEINGWLARDLEQAATGLIDLADHLLHDLIVDYPTEAVKVVRQQISSVPDL
jgi:lincosamide nucleotidyltransferase